MIFMRTHFLMFDELFSFSFIFAGSAFSSDWFLYLVSVRNNR